MGSKSRMQGKAAQKLRTDQQSDVGIDVCQSWLDIYVLPEAKELRVANNAEGIRKLKKWLKPFDIAMVAVEATGKWHRLVVRSLTASAIPVAVTDPYRVRCFAKAGGVAAKTDRLDARVLALYAKLMKPEIRTLTPETIENLRELVVARDHAVGAVTALKNQRHAACDKFLIGLIEKEIVRADKYVAKLDGEIIKRIKADPGLKRRYDIVTSVPGIGDVTAMTLIAYFDELGTCSPKQIASLAGLAPRANESGQSIGKREIGGGRAIVRKALYLSALTASRLIPSYKALSDRIKAKGSCAKVALIAVARKLAVVLNTLVAADRLWSETPPKTS